MDWKAELASSIEAAVAKALERYASVEESPGETARRRTMWFGEAGRRRIELVEDRMRRDPVWAAKVARRRAAFAAATSTSPASASILTADVVCDGKLTAQPPTTCSTDCPVRAATSVVSTITPAAASTPSTGTVGVVSEQCYFNIEPAPVTSTSPAAASIFSGDTSMVIGEAPVTTACTARDGCVYPVAQLEAMPIPVPVARAGCAPTMGSPSTDVTQSPRVLTPATTKPTSSVAHEFGIIMAPPTTSSEVCHDPSHVAPAVMLMEATLDIADSNGSGAGTSMSAPLHIPEDADTDVMHEDQQLLVCSSVERPLALVTAWDVADDHNFITGTSPILRTLATVGVDDGQVTNKHKVLLLLESLLTLSESKESGMCSSLGCATTHSCCLLPWDPGETTRLLKYSVLSTATVWGTCVKQLNADSVGSSDQRQKLRQYMERLVASDLTYYPAICAEQVPSEDFLSGFFGLVQNNCQPQYLEVFESCYCSELMFKGATHLSPEYIPWKIAWLLVLSADTHSLAIERKPRPPPPTIHVFVPARERNAWMQSWFELLLFKNDNALEALLCCDTTGNCWMNKHMGLTVGNDTDSGEFMSSVPAHSCKLINGFHYEKIWDPGGLCSCAWNCQVRSTEQGSPLKGMCAIQYLMKPPAGVNCYQISIDLHASSSHADCYPQTIAETRSLSCVGLSIGHFVQYLTYVLSLLTMVLVSTQPRNCMQMFQPRPLWAPLVNVFSSSSSKYFYPAVHLVVPIWTSTRMSTEDNQCKCGWRAQCLLVGFLVQVVSNQNDIAGKLTLIHKLLANIFDVVDPISRGQAVPLLMKLFRSSEQGATFSESLLPLVSVALLSADLQLLWDPEAQGRRDVAVPAYYRGHCLDQDYYFDKVCADQDYHIDLFRDQVHIGHDYYLVRDVCYLNLAKVYLDYGIHRNLSEDMKQQVPWDPSGSTWHRLGVKPNSKEGGMLATNPPVTWAWPWATGLGPHRRDRVQIHSEWLRTDWLGTGRLRPPLLLSSPSSSLPLASPFLMVELSIPL